MKIGIIGAGNVGSNLGKGLAQAGHNVMYSSRTPNSETMQALIKATGNEAQVGTVEETLAYGDVIAVAVHWDVLEDVLSNAGDWTGKIVIDTTNRFIPASSNSIGSSSADIAHITGAPVVKAFNTIGAEHLTQPIVNGQQASMFYCGDDSDAKSTVKQLITDLGFDPIDVGGLDKAELLESLTRLWVGLARGGYGRGIALKLLRETS